MRAVLQRLIDLAGHPTVGFVAALDPSEPAAVRRLKLTPGLPDGTAGDPRIDDRHVALTAALADSELDGAHGVVAAAAPDQPAQVVPLPHTTALEGTWVCRTPRVRDLLRALDYTRHHRILAVAEQDSRLFCGDGSGNLVEHVGQGFPLTHAGPTGRQSFIQPPPPHLLVGVHADHPFSAACRARVGRGGLACGCAWGGASPPAVAVGRRVAGSGDDAGRPTCLLRREQGRCNRWAVEHHPGLAARLRIGHTLGRGDMNHG